MRKGFSLLELLVASLLLGMLMTILTMVFNQSSIAWRTGIAGLSDLDEVRETVGKVRNEADNVYVWKQHQNNGLATIRSIWRSDADESTGSGKLRNRAVNASGCDDEQEGERITALNGKINTANTSSAGSAVPDGRIFCGSGESGGGAVTYSVNVRSRGPDHKANTYDDIWSFPDDFAL